MGKNPIIETALEITTTFNVPADAVVGMLYSFSSEKNKKISVQKLPASNIPEEIRRINPNLKNKPTHQITLDNGYIQIGERILCLGMRMPYSSWNDYNSFILFVWDILTRKSIIKGITDIKLRYLNFYEENIYETINLSIKMGDEKIENISTIFRTQVKCNDKIIGVLQITNGVHVKNVSLDIDSDGSLLDIQTVTKNISLETFSDVVCSLHKEIENLFLRLTQK